MCAINGFNFNDRDLILKMNQVTSHRGPDSSGHFCSDDISLGHNRLSIIDLSDEAGQPMHSFDGKEVIVFNGEIYNFQELKKELQGYPFKTKSDTEVILAAYKKWGRECVKKLDGIFAFAIWDREKKEIFLARDHLGVKPLYYFLSGGRFVFSSEIKAILQHNVPREIDKRALSSYFHLLYSLAPLTIYKNIFKVPPAHFTTFSIKSGDLKVEKYWDLNKIEIDKKISKNEAKKRLRILASGAVKKQMISDRPIGVFLSGGIDSTLVAALVKKHTSEKIKTFSVGFDVEDQNEKFNFDFNMARRVSKDFDTDHHELMIAAKDVLGVLEKVAWHMDEPISNHTQPMTYLLSKLAKEKVAVVLGGDGGDEIFGGYPRYRYNLMLDYYQKLPVFLRRAFLDKAVARYKHRDTLSQKLDTPSGVERYLLFMSQKDANINKIIRKDFLEDDWFLKKLKEDYGKTDFKTQNGQMMYSDLKNWLAEESLMRSDKTTMAFGLEERVPLLDKNLVEFGFSLPDSHKLGFIDYKKILKEAHRDYLPDYVINAPKRGWFTPAAKWLRTDLKDFAYEILSESYCPATKEFFDFKELEKALNDHISKKKYNLPLIWSVMSFQMWYKNFMC